MKRMLKPITAVLAVVAALVMDVHADTEIVAGCTWTYEIVDGKTATITATDFWLPATATIPSKLGGKTVTAIGPEAFKSRNVVSVTIPAGVTAIGEGAFTGSRLRSVKIPDSVTAIGASAFRGCSSLVCADIGKKVGDIGEAVFESCSMLDALVFRGNAPANVADQVFSGVPEGCSVYVPKSAKGWPADGESWNGLPVVVGDRIVHVSVDVDSFNDDEAYGTVSGDGDFAVGKKITLKAAPAKGCIFGGWTEYGQTDIISYSKSFAYTVDGYHDRDRPLFTARFKKAEDDILFLQPGDITAWDGYVDQDMLGMVRSFSEPKITFKGLPAGVKYDSKTLRLSGSAKTPGEYKVEVSAVNATKMSMSASFVIKVPNIKDYEEIPLQDSYGPFIPGVPLDPSTIAGAAGCKVTGLPSGMKWADKDIMKKGSKTEVEIPANSYYGTPTKPGSYTVFFTKTVDGVKHTATATFKVGPFPVLTVDSFDNGTGKVTGAGEYAANKKVTLKATADTKDAAATDKKPETKKSVFAGWYEVPDPEAKPISLAPSYSYEMPATDKTLYARFITARKDADYGVGLAIDGVNLEPVSAEQPESFATNVMCGVYFKWPVAVDALSLTTVKVAGLPAGLKFTAKDIVDSKTKKVTVPANTIYGTPTKASKWNASTGLYEPTMVKITATTAGKTAVNYAVALTVEALPVWAVGTFYGGGELGQATLTVATTGKISGKYLTEGLVWSFAADSFTSFDSDSNQYVAMLVAKSGKEAPRTLQILIKNFGELGAAGGIVDVSGELGSFQLLRTDWKVEPWKTVGKAIANKTLDLEGTACELPTDEDKVTLKFSANGSVTVNGKFAAYGKTYTASGSSMLVPLSNPEGESFSGVVVVYFPPKSGKFDEFASIVYLSWDGEKFIYSPAE